MNIFRFATALTVSLVSAIASAAVPEVSDVVMTQSKTTREVTISYRLSDPAVVTLDIVTNSPSGWVSIGVSNVMNVTGDVWKRVGAGEHVLRWRPDKAWAGNDVTLDQGGAKAVVTAWATNDTPDYMVVDITDGVARQTVNFYPNADYLSGGLLANTNYRTTKIVMRRINAANVPWTMGSNFESGRSAASEAGHMVTLTDNYYIGVFELTQGQFKEVTGVGDMSGYRDFADSALRPLNSVSYNKMRCAPCTKAGANTYLGGGWPLEPYTGSFLDLLRQRTGVAFDLPSEAQWEFACRSGTCEGQWNDGSVKVDTTLPGEWLNGKAPSDAVPVACGSYAPSKWGLYDMHGNIYELCHDWHQNNITALGGAVNIDPENPLNKRDGTAGSVRVRRGGACHCAWAACSASIRNVSYDPASFDNKWGYRLVCPVGIGD